MEPIKTRNEPSSMSAPTYQPMLDIHPNPYGVPKPNTLPNFSNQPPSQYNSSHPPPSSYDVRDHVPLPSRDIPRETHGYTQDEQTRVNYIPQAKLTSDFVSHHDHLNEEKWEEYGRKKHRLSKLDFLVNEFQTPFFLSLLFFVFLMPGVNSLFHRTFSLLSIYSADGNLNTYGLVLKSFIFGAVYYLSLKIMEYFIE
jgi:hypothetical protein